MEMSVDHAWVPWQIEESGWCDGCRMIIEWIVERDLQDAGWIRQEISNRMTQQCQAVEEKWKDIPWNVTNGFNSPELNAEYRKDYNEATTEWKDYLERFSEAQDAHRAIYAKGSVISICQDYEQHMWCATCLGLMLEELNEQSV